MYTSYKKIRKEIDNNEIQRKKKPIAAVSDLPHVPPAPLPPYVVPKIKFNSKSKSPKKRPKFEKWVIPRKKGYDRCHTVSVSYIQQFIISWLNDKNRDSTELFKFVLSLDAVPDDDSDKDMAWAYQATCEDYVNDICTALAKSDLSFAAQQATELLSIAASAKHNLRYGAPGTNSSIRDALDLPADSVIKTTLQPRTIVLNEFGQYVPLEEPLAILLLPYASPTAQQILPIIQSGRVDVSIYTTGNTIVSSDNPNQNHGQTLPPGNLPFGVETEDGKVILFDT
ncbi:MAG: hypothetical protein NC089_06865 [Bacteroides sp.]|nr:hypothetical protein [Bacteroides sp.]MCM1548430.1 hypothetical protein [Clostridium sp.]